LLERQGKGRGKGEGHDLPQRSPEKKKKDGRKGGLLREAAEGQGRERKEARMKKGIQNEGGPGEKRKRGNQHLGHRGTSKNITKKARCSALTVGMNSRAWLVRKKH